MSNVIIAYEKIEVSERCEQGKLGRPDRDSSVQAGWEIWAGTGISPGAARPLFIVLNFERGEKLETALLSISIVWYIYILYLTQYQRLIKVYIF